MKQMYDVENTNEPEIPAEQRLGAATRRIQKIDEQMEQLEQERVVMAQDINRATDELQSSIEKAQQVLSASVKPVTQDGEW